MFNATQTENVDHVEFVVTPSGRTHTTQDAHAGFHSVFHSRLDKHENSWLPLRCSLLAPSRLRRVTFCTACLDCSFPSASVRKDTHFKETRRKPRVRSSSPTRHGARERAVLTRKRCKAIRREMGLERKEASGHIQSGVQTSYSKCYFKEPDFSRSRASIQGCPQTPVGSVLSLRGEAAAA